MKRNLLKILFLLFLTSFILSIINIPVYASNRYAYSIGTLFATSSHYGDDFRQNIYNAANIYGTISGITSYYRTEPDYTYMRSNNALGQRKIGSYIVFLNGHANRQFITMASSDTTNNRTGVSTAYDGTATLDGQVFTLAGLKSTNMSNTGIISFVGCHTGDWPSGSVTTNLPLTAVSQGANAALGFRNDISSRTTLGQNWLIKYNQSLVNGYTIDGSLTAACLTYPTSDLSTCVMAEGNVNSSIVPLLNLNANNNSNNSEYRKLQLADININIDIQPNECVEEQELIDCCTSFEPLIKLIKDQDPSFDINQYKVSTNIVNKDYGIFHIFFTKYLNSNIKTNKVYLIIAKANQLCDIYIAGIKKCNFEKEETNNEKIINSVVTFENNKSKEISKINSKELQVEIGLDNKIIQIANQYNNISDFKEYYYYDYNTEKLSYNIQYVKNCELDTTECEEISIEIDL